MPQLYSSGLLGCPLASVTPHTPTGAPPAPPPVTCQLPLPYQVRGTLCRLRAAWMEGRDEDLRCHIYQIRGAASWVCADRLLGATEELMRAYQERKC